MALVTLLAHTPQPELHVAAAAKLCYSPSSIDKIKEGLTEEKVASFVDMLSEIGHESPIEHATFTFGIEGVSRALLAQITRHRIASLRKTHLNMSYRRRLPLYPRQKKNLYGRWKKTSVIMKT